MWQGNCKKARGYHNHWSTVLNSSIFMTKHTAAIGALVFSGCLSPCAFASPINPTFDRFGALAEATWGGSGIPNDAVAITEIDIFSDITSGAGQIESGESRPRQIGTITLGLSSHGRYDNVDEGNNGAGTFYASTGSNTPPSSNLPGATWNFNFYINFTPAPRTLTPTGLNDFDFAIYYDFDPGKGTLETDHGVIDISGASIADSVTTVQGSQNLLFSYLGESGIPGITPPPGTFDPWSAGEYTFALTANDGTGELGRSAITVNAVPTPISLSLFGLGLACLGWSKRKKA